MTVRSERTKRILELLAAGDMTQADIAREVEVSREYVRQLATRKTKEALTFKSDYLRGLREARSWTMDDLAKKVGVAESEVSRWEKGIHVPRLDRIKKLGKIFGIDSHKFVTMEGSPQ